MDAEKMKSCSLFLDNIDDYLDGELDETVSKAVKEHLDSCDECARIMNESLLLLKELSTLDADTTIPLQCQAAWRKAVRGEAKRVSGRKTVKRFFRAAGAIAAAAVVIFGVSRFMPATKNAMPKSVPVAAEDMDFGETAEAAYTSYASSRNAAGGMLLQADGEYDLSAKISGDVDDASAQSVIIRNAKRKIETQNFDQCLKSISDLVEEYQGYFEQNTVEGREIEPGASKGRVSDMVARVPSGDLDAFLTGVDAVGTVTYSRATAEDISESYYDTKTRLESYRKQLDRLNELVTTAADLEQLLMLEEKISDVQYSIDSLEGTIKSWDSQTSYSKVTVTVTEVAARDRITPPARSLGERAKLAFYDGINWLNEFAQNLVVALAAAAPVLIILIPLAIIVLIVVFIVKKKRR